MKKICAFLLTVFLLFSLFSCNYDPKLKDWGPTYGKQLNYEGFQVCLRSDGYYQIVGFTRRAMNNNNLFIPQYIYGKQVMGFGANVDNNGLGFLGTVRENTLYGRVHNRGYEIPLEYERTSEFCRWLMDGTEAFYSYHGAYAPTINKVYINCHHINALNQIFERVDPLYLDNGSSALISDDLQYYIDINYDNYFSGHNRYESRTSNLAAAISGPESRVYDSQIYNRRYKLYNDAIEDHIPKFIAYAKESGKELSRLFRDCTADSFDSPEFYNYYVNFLKEHNPFNPLCANVEFYYNLTIDGVEYHNVNRPESNVYCFDYINDNEKIINPLDPYAEGYKFLGWYTEPECTNKFDFSTKVKAVDGEQLWLKLYAKWEKE